MFLLIAGAIVAAPAVLAAAGFTAGGIAAGSVASTLMSAAAVANGGGVAAGGVVAVLQSAGETNIWTFYFLSSLHFNNKTDLCKGQIGYTNLFHVIFHVIRCCRNPFGWSSHRGGFGSHCGGSC